MRLNSVHSLDSHDSDTAAVAFEEKVTRSVVRVGLDVVGNALAIIMSGSGCDKAFRLLKRLSRRSIVELNHGWRDSCGVSSFCRKSRCALHVRGSVVFGAWSIHSVKHPTLDCISSLCLLPRLFAASK